MSDLYDTIKKLCDQKGVSPSRMCIDIGIQPSVAGDLKAGRKKGMSAKTALKVAEYFGVSVSYLLGNEKGDEKTPTIVLSDSERELLELYRATNPNLQNLVLQTLRSSAPSQQAPGVGVSD